MRLFVDEHMVRAWPGGAGDVKIAGNYSPTIEPLVAAARDYGASQSLFVLPQGPDRDQAVLSEAGGMNFFAYIDKVSGAVNDGQSVMGRSQCEVAKVPNVQLCLYESSVSPLIH